MLPLRLGCFFLRDRLAAPPRLLVSRLVLGVCSGLVPRCCAFPLPFTGVNCATRATWETDSPEDELRVSAFTCVLGDPRRNNALNSLQASTLPKGGQQTVKRLPDFSNFTHTSWLVSLRRSVEKGICPAFIASFGRLPAFSSISTWRCKSAKLPSLTDVQTSSYLNSMSEHLDYHTLIGANVPGFRVHESEEKSWINNWCILLNVKFNAPLKKNDRNLPDNLAKSTSPDSGTVYQSRPFGPRFWALSETNSSSDSFTYLSARYILGWQKLPRPS